jgi:glycine/D-amino acid oxidase-like deaminating enzyme/nitrite reductase/ring-hydroxylating ferredoxin subunit
MEEMHGYTPALPGRHESFWVATTKETDYPPLEGDVTVDVAVVGGGIAGLAAAFLLGDAGFSVAVLEMRRILKGVTGYTTAKLTSSHGIFYHDLILRFGAEKARMYADANQRAIDWVELTARERGIDCDFERTSAWTYTSREEEVRKVRFDYEAAHRLGLPVAFEDSPSLPFGGKAAVRYDLQARFHPRKFLLGLAERFAEKGGMIFENTRARGFEEGAPCTVRTNRGKIVARDVIIATNYPFVYEGLYFTRLFPYRSYVVGIRAGNPPSRDMYYEDQPYHTVRPHPADGGELILVGGEEHKTGFGGDTVERYRRVAEYARKYFDVASIDYWWSAHDADSADGVPYIGRLTQESMHAYVATGFGGWGMTHGIIAGQLLADLIQGKKNPWSRLYNPSRVMVTGKTVGQFVMENFSAVGHLVTANVSRGEKASPSDLRAGEGNVYSTGAGKAAISRDANGVLHAVSANCPHLGCIVRWNPAEQSWDCPCHGSRFDPGGEILQGPTVKKLKKRIIREENT